jgi:hypothetical protein
MSSQNSAVREESSEDKENESENTTDIGKYNKHEILMVDRRVPEYAKCPDDFAINIYVPHSSKKNDIIARIDNDHGEVHIDRLYLDRNSESYKDFEIDVKTPREAIEYFVGTEDVEEARWKKYTRYYEENHGL